MCDLNMGEWLLGAKTAERCHFMCLGWVKSSCWAEWLQVISTLVRKKALQLCVDMADLLGLSPEAEIRAVTPRQHTFVFSFQTFASQATKNILWLMWDNRTLMESRLNTSLWAWILDFLTARPPAVRVGSPTSKPLTLNIGTSKVVYLCPRCTLCTYTTVWSGTAPTPSSSLLMTTGWITSNDEKAYLEVVADLSLRHKANNLLLKLSRTKGVQIIENLTLYTYTIILERKARLYHLRQLKKSSFIWGPEDLLFWCCGKHPNRGHYQPVWDLLCSGP